MKKIFEEVELKNLTARNRLVRSATWEGIANSDGSITEESYAIYQELARGGVGTIITGWFNITKIGTQIYLGRCVGCCVFGTCCCRNKIRNTLPITR